MKYCSNCLQPDTRPTPSSTKLARPACSYFAQLQHVDWLERFEHWKDVLARFPRRPGQYYDRIDRRQWRQGQCPPSIVDTRQARAAAVARMSQLPVALEQVTECGVDNISNRSSSVSMLSSRRRHWHLKRLMRDAFMVH